MNINNEPVPAFSGIKIISHYQDIISDIYEDYCGAHPHGGEAAKWFCEKGEHYNKFRYFKNKFTIR